MSFGKVFRVCESKGCANTARIRSAYCDRCIILRGQHSISHEMEGHSKEFILGCPICDRLQQLAKGI